MAPLAARTVDATAPRSAPRSKPTEVPSEPPPPFRPSRLRKYRDLLHAKAEALLEHGEVVIETNGNPLYAKILRFRDGTGVLEYRYESAHGSSTGESRLDPQFFGADWVAHLLEMALLNARVRPVAGQEI